MQSTIVTHILKHKALYLTLLLYVLAVLIINPFGEYAVNDDWDFITHVRNFTQGDFTKNRFIDSAFILQGFIGATWALIFGVSFAALRVLTMIFTLVFIFLLYKILKLLHTSNTATSLILLAAVFNPFTLISSMSFMTELYFLVFVLAGVCIFLKYIDNNKPLWFWLAVLFSSFSILIRQIGLLVVPAIFIFALLFKKTQVKDYIIGAFITLSITAVLFLWPQYFDNGSKSVSFLVNTLDSLKNILQLPSQVFYALPYFGLILIPFGLFAFSALNKKVKLGILITTAVLFVAFYPYDIFKLGNVLYPEGIMIKTNNIHTLSLIDNIPFTVTLTVACLMAVLSVACYVYIQRSRFNNKQSVYLGILFVLLTVPVLIYDGFFDRYLLNGLIIFLLLISPVLSTLRYKKPLVALICFLYMFYSVLLIQDFVISTKTKWLSASMLTSTGSLFLNDTYTKYNYVFSKPNDDNLLKNMPSGLDYKCYVQKDTQQKGGSFINKIENSRVINFLVANPEPFGEKTLPGFRPPTREASKILNKTEINVFANSLVGTRTFIVTYCQ